MTTGLTGFTDGDIVRLAELAGCRADELPAELRRKPWRLGELLSDPAADEAIDPTSVGTEAGAPSPYLLFAVLTHRAANDIRDASFVNDWMGPRMRLPVFDVEPLREFAEESRRLLFLAGVLASFSAPSATLAVPADGLDLHDLAHWLDAAMPADRASLLRHLGDLALFLGGVFPDRTGPQAVTPAEAEKLGGSAGLDADEILGLLDAASPSPGLDALDSLGPRWYDKAARERTAPAPPIVSDIATRFRAARRFLNHIADRYLFPPPVSPANSVIL
jgi:hypothetical protein